MKEKKKKNQCHLDKNPHSYTVVPTRQAEGEDFFYYNNKDDEVEALETLGYNLKQGGYLEEDSWVSKFW